MDEMKGQQDGFDSQMARAMLAASDQQTSFDNQMAKSELEASGMRAAYDQLISDNAEQKESAVQVGLSGSV